MPRHKRPLFNCSHIPICLSSCSVFALGPSVVRTDSVISIHALRKGKGMTEKPYDYSHKVLIVGDSGVGKTCILLRFVDVTFNPDFVATIGEAAMVQ